MKQSYYLTRTRHSLSYLARRGKSLETLALEQGFQTFVDGPHKLIQNMSRAGRLT